MRGKILVATLAILVGGSSVGCKSMPNMAWWRTASKDAPEAAVLAHSAPELPSEIAKQVEGIASSTTGQLAGGVAAPFVPGTSIPPAVNMVSASTSGPYPNTKAPAFTPTPPATAVPTAPATASLGTLAMPYNPNAVPQAAVTAAPAVAPANVDRYAAASTSGSGTKSPVTPYPSTASRYGGQVASTPAATMSSTPANQEVASAQLATPPVASGSTASLGSRYAQTTAAIVPTANLPSNTLAVPTDTTSPTATEVAGTTQYRPGGTSSYPGISNVQAPVQVASRPEAPVVNTAEVPNTSLPSVGSLPTAPGTTQVPRYR